MSIKKFIRRFLRFVFAGVGFLVIIILLPSKQVGCDLIIRPKMSHEDQIKLFSKITKFPRVFFVLSHLKTIRAGEYTFPKNANGLMILNILWSGKQRLCKFKIPEGFSANQILSLLKDTCTLKGEMPEEIPEGAIVATTYHYARGTSRRKLMQFMLSESKKIRSKILEAGMIWKDENEWITFASILEREGLDYEDKKQIAGVLLNRIKKKMRLQVDATLLYVKTDGKYDARISMDEIVSKKFSNGKLYDNQYNTYLYAGLPKAPIASPGTDALKIAANPVVSKFLYYRLVGGRHVFSESFSKHKALAYNAQPGLSQLKKYS